MSDLARLLDKVCDSRKVDGITFWPVNGRWQVSVRIAGSNGWRIVTDEFASAGLHDVLTSVTQSEKVGAKPRPRDDDI